MAKARGGLSHDLSNRPNTTRIDLKTLAFGISALLAACIGDVVGAQAAEKAPGKSFVENFDSLDKQRWYVSDGWSNGDSSELRLVEGPGRSRGRHSQARLR